MPTRGRLDQWLESELLRLKGRASPLSGPVTGQPISTTTRRPAIVTSTLATAYDAA